MSTKHAFEQETKQIIDVLRNTYADIQAINNPEIAALKARIMSDIRRHENALCLQLGQDIQLHEEVTVNNVKMTAQPLTKLFGKEIKPISRNEKPAIDETKPLAPSSASDIKSAQEIELSELRIQRDEVYNRFVATTTDDILDNMDDLLIRAVAKRAGLPVTDTNPKKITAKYVEQVKEAIRKQIDIAAKGSAGTETNSSNAANDQQ